jgi:carbonic anhydrase
MKHFPDHLADRFRRFKYRHFAPNQDHYEKLATEGQNPDVMVVSCCDSRVDPETLFSAMPGELFVVRNVANLVPPFETQGKYHGVSAALEFAALNIRVKHIVVLGHSGCGGVRACLEHDAAKQTKSEFIRNWMSMLNDARDKVIFAHAGNPGVSRHRLRTCALSPASRFWKDAAASSFTAPISTLQAGCWKCWTARRASLCRCEVCHSGRAERGPESITTILAIQNQSWLWIPGWRLRRAPE